ncbi:DoxX family protein [Bacteroides sp. 51]|uniref:DoxX family protein n=1 Tax=Bacteroides sp. 51 TaxID=2302938 RepID=UPI0013D18DA5|nr:DoxX family protein [Bacteroides sp. 51]NDV81943.1 DoxX family protein [Bacteroides sp. 51]
MIYNLLFPRKPDTTGASLLLLSARIIFGLLFLSHGIQKWSNFQELSSVFPDPLGVGSSVSLGLAIFAELACSIGFMFGILYRLAIIPMIFTMLMAFFVIHGADPFAVKELALVYLVIFVLMLLAGPGKFSVDSILGKILAKNKRK